MNGLNASLFALIGSVMGLLPMAFPSWFPPSGADQASARALWLGTMGVAQIVLGLGYIVRAQIVPYAKRILSATPAGERGPIVFGATHAVAGR